MNKIVVGIGEILWDVLPSGKVLGGAPANFAYHVNQLGYKGLVVSSVGFDKLGDEVLSQLLDKQLEGIIERIDSPTGTVKVTIDKSGVPSYDITQNVAWDYIPFTTSIQKLAQSCDAVCYGTLAQRSETSRESIMRFIKMMPSHSLKVYDINLRQHYYTRKIIETSLYAADILKINDDELTTICTLLHIAGSNELEISRILIKRYALSLVILTKGIDGSLIVQSNNDSFQMTSKVKVVDTVGAGDAFTAAFIVSYLNGRTIEEAHRAAVEFSAFVCTKAGAMPKLSEIKI
ncbi:MAG: carbohydrate kinase [Bacteroidales bacterium]|nr:carbohydrate kinase [Bacteroidales bacterium]